ncbi:MAG: RNA helicase [Treponema sp. CETP13]|nr:MAG: RNA helicase [Treponema sp. CETP13]
MKFTEFSLHEDLLTGIAKAGYETCTPVQEQVIKTALNKQDLYVQSQTGTGKTAAYLITIIQQMLTQDDENRKQALIMVPTRELAVQVQEEARKLMSGTSLKSGSFYGGVGYGQQVNTIKEGVNIMIGTPGRVIDLNESNQMSFKNVGYLVIDEADRMFDMGFYPDLRKLIKVIPSDKNRQTMLFSATLNTYVKNLAWEYTTDVQEIEIESGSITVEEINQKLFHVSSDDKMKLLLGIITKEKPESLIVFCNTKRSCEVIAKRMKINGIECEYIIGDLPQSKRMQVLDSFKRGSLKCLVATDVAARGIDVDNLSMVVNYDLPNEAENYIHRIGRTARAGKSGLAYTFCSEQDVYNLPAIERYAGATIPSQVADSEMFTEDKSAGTYIRTGNFADKRYENRNGRNNGKDTRSRNSRTQHANRYTDNHHDKKSTNRTYDKKKNSERMQNSKKPEQNNYKGKQTNKSYRQNTKSNIDNRDMSQMSFEERMKLYREKYSSPADKTATSTTRNINSSKNYTRKHTNKNGKTNPKNQNKYQNKNFKTSKTPVKTAIKPKKAKQKPPRKGVGNIFTRIFIGRL